MEPRPPVSATITDIVFPSNANHYGTAFGGWIVALIDKAAWVACVKYCQAEFVTVSIDNICFHEPVRVSDVIEVTATVAAVGTRSIVVHVQAITHSTQSKGSRECVTAWIALVAPKGTELPPLDLQTDPQRELNARALEFKQRSKERNRR